MSRPNFSFQDPMTLTAASAVAFLSLNRSDLSVTDTITFTSAHLWTFTAQIVLPNDPATALQAATKQYVDNNLSTVQPANSTAAVGPWTAYTPTWTGSGSNPAIGNGALQGMWRRVGDSMELELRISTGTTTTYGSGTWYLSLPPGYTIDTTKINSTLNSILGVASYVGTTSSDGFAVWGSSTTIAFIVGSSNVTNTVPFTWTSGQLLVTRVTIPIAQWSANINLLTSFTEYAYNTSVTTSSDTTSFGYGPTGVVIQAFAPSGFTNVAKRVRFTQAIKSTDLLILESASTGSTNWIPFYYVFGSTASAYFGAALNIVNSTDVDVQFFSAASQGTTWSAQAGLQWRVRKVSNGNFAQGSPSYPQTIGDGSSTSIVVTHNLGTTDIAVNIWELTGNKRQVTSGVEVRNTSTTQCTLVFATAPATNSLRVEVFSSGGTQTSGDMLGSIVNAENLITTTANALIRTWNACTATSANYTVTLPQASLCSGQLIAIRIDTSSTYLVTVAGYGGTDLIDGVNTRIMWAGESAVLKSNGTSWNKVSGRTIPMSALLTLTANQTFAASTITKLNFTTSVFTNGPAALVTAGSAQFNILRPSNYSITAQLSTNNSNSSVCAIEGYIYSGASQIAYAINTYQVTSRSLLITTFNGSLAAGVAITASADYGAGSFTTSFPYINTPSPNQFILQELPTW